MVVALRLGCDALLSGRLVSGQLGLGLFRGLPSDCKPARDHRPGHWRMLLQRGGGLFGPRSGWAGLTSSDSGCCSHCSLSMMLQNRKIMTRIFHFPSLDRLPVWLLHGVG